MSRTAAARIVLAVVALVAGLGAAAQARGENAAPVIELLAPTDGAKVLISSEQNKWPTYKARITYPTDYTGPMIVSFDTSLDAAFSPQNTGGNTLTCATGVPVCEVGYTSRTDYKPGTRVFWRVRIADRYMSPTQSYVTTGTSPAAAGDRDRDGVPDNRDNCPSKRNPGQNDFEGDGKGDACQPDTKKPRVKAYSGWERRGQYAQFLWRAVDNRPVTIRLTLRWRGRLVLAGSMPNVAAQTWGATAATWESEKPIPASFPIGTYTYCVSATDAAGHKATSCAPYRITP